MDGMAPLDVVVKILNNQLGSLTWIDEKVRISHVFLFLISKFIDKIGQHRQHFHQYLNLHLFSVCGKIVLVPITYFPYRNMEEYSFETYCLFA